MNSEKCHVADDNIDSLLEKCHFCKLPYTDTEKLFHLDNLIHKSCLEIIKNNPVHQLQVTSINQIE